MDLTYNPHFARRVRPYTLLHWPDRQEVEGWIDAQARAAPAGGKPGTVEPSALRPE